MTNTGLNQLSCLTGLLIKTKNKHGKDTVNPSLADLTCDVLQHLLHVGVLIPELVGPGQDSDCAVPHVTGMIHLAIPSHTKHSCNTLTKMARQV